MSPRTHARRGLALALTLAGTLALAACDGAGSGATASTPTSGPPASGAACATAPTPAANLPGWDVSSQSPSLYPVLIAGPGELTCGPTRLLLTFLDRDNRPAGAPDRTASIAIYNLGRDHETPIATVDGTFTWAIEDRTGIYVANVTLPEAGLYGAEVTTAAGAAAPEKIRLAFEVRASSALVKVGQPAPSTDNPTLADVDGDISRVSTDADPEPALYETTVAQALDEGKPFLVAFATPKFCQTAQCGPTLDRLKPFVERYPDVAFINVEPYELAFEDGTLQVVLDPTTKSLIPVDATIAWGLSSEPWVFVVDGDGMVVGSYGLIFTDEELTAALDAIS